MDCCKRSLSLTSAAIIGGHHDLLMEILLLLPEKPLIRFQLVSKQWQSLISSTSFYCLHTFRHHRCRRSKPLPSFILRSILARFYYFNPTTKVFVPFPFDFSYPRILQSSHGLLLVESKKSPYGRKDYCVYNPTTRQSRKFWLNNGDSNKKETISGLCLAFDPFKSPHYKVVCVKGTENSDNEYMIEVYDSETHTWNRLGQTFLASLNAKFCNGIYWNNGIYWIRPRAKSYYLDLEKGIVGTPPRIRIPRRKLGESNKNYILESNGHMHCVSIYLQPEKKSLLVFELLDNNSYWFEKYRANLNPISAVFTEMNGPAVNVLGIIRGESEEESAVLFHVPEKIIFYRFYDGGFGVLFDMKMQNFHTEAQLHFDRNQAYQFIETLSPV